jgi:hypothetical protein
VWRYGYLDLCPSSGPGKLRCGWTECTRMVAGTVVVVFAGTHDRLCAVFHEPCWRAYQEGAGR